MSSRPLSASCAVDPSAWAVEWSPDQRCIHVDQLGEVVETNLEMALRSGQCARFVLIGIFATHEEAEVFARDVEARLAAVVKTPRSHVIDEQGN